MNLPTIPESIYAAAWRRWLQSGEAATWDDALDAVWPDLYALAVASLPAATPWQPVEPGTVIKAGTRYRTTYNGGVLLATEVLAAKDFAAGEDYNYSIDPRTVPDPDADLVEAIGAVLTHYEGGKWESESVAILAAIRETHTVEPKPVTGPLGGAR